ncbi:carbohydrate ABC transporter permease [Deinococcus multiflagellatus]|uniref:Carbohydrate ABC transporter permease n=1 Tax=Deinococcus multiflagellatus TaxID=1656887 RepID=A0ABW1ZFX9_9DEIO|nr:sugar ABC transporter permease [Deinococcus multiflagellatus]MBZ9712915.1 sugar ABC transporter permease [Deinococcus multiflagellatus]
MTTTQAPATHAPTGTRRRGSLEPYLYLLPHAALFFMFTVYPIGYGLYISLHRWDLLNNTQTFVGTEFFRNLFTSGTPQFEFFWRTLWNTTFFTLVSVPLLVAAALGLAALLHRPIFGRTFFRAVFFMPGILTVSVMGILWRWMFDNQIGLVNAARDLMTGAPPIAWLSTEGLAWVPIVVGTVWWTVGFNMTLYLAAMSNIPHSLYEAAALDGATGGQQFRFITWPMLTPITLFVVITTALASFQLFGQSLVITNGGPTRSTQSVIQYITEEGFTNSQISSAAAMGFVFGLMMLVLTAAQFRLMARDVQSTEEK